MADPHPQLGPELAGRVSLQGARRFAGGHRDLDAVSLRQLGGESSQSELAAEARGGRESDDGRDGSLVAAGFARGGVSSRARSAYWRRAAGRPAYGTGRSADAASVGEISGRFRGPLA